MTLHMIELSVRDGQATAAWYGTVAGAVIELADHSRGFLLLTLLNAAVKMALKQGDVVADGTMLHFRVADLAAELQRLAALGIHPTNALKTSDEGYTRARLTDPDGRTVVLFEWIKNFTAERTESTEEDKNE